ncbi:MAG: T9SS type A sorting domain-containing protein, partial [Saprospiraceae bacterium]|nr:T9SS type A sorting domain-containing protein [Saprospiraceae bacterium]
GEYLVLCENMTVFSALHPGVPKLIGDLDFGLGNSGDLIRLYDPEGTIRLSICYDDSAPWNTDADGEGYTLELSDPGLNLNDPGNWFAGCLGGSPGGAYDPDCIPVGIKPVTSSADVSIFPNPFDVSFSVHLKHEEEGTLRIYDVFGKMILQQNLTHQYSTIQSDGWSAGMYFVVTEVNGVEYVEKLQKM